MTDSSRRSFGKDLQCQGDKEISDNTLNLSSTRGRSSSNTDKMGDFGTLQYKLYEQSQNKSPFSKPDEDVGETRKGFREVIKQGSENYAITTEQVQDIQARNITQDTEKKNAKQDELSYFEMKEINEVKTKLNDIAKQLLELKDHMFQVFSSVK